MITNLPLLSASLFCSWLLGGLIFHFPAGKKISGLKRFLLMLFLYLFIRYMPVYGGLSLAYILRGIIGDLSITTLLILLTFIYGELQNNNNCYKISKFIWISIFLLDLILCLSAFGSIPIDIYSFGYFPKGLLIFYFIMQILYWQFSRKLAFIWLIAFAGYMFQVLPSHNLWDYLLDPILWLISLSFILASTFIKIINSLKKR